MAGAHVDNAKLKGALRTIPTKRASLVVTAGASTQFDFSNLTLTGGGTADVRGKWVRLQARDGDVTVKRGAAAITEAGDGVLIAAPSRGEEFWIDPNDTPLCQNWGQAGTTPHLEISFDDKT